MQRRLKLQKVQQQKLVKNSNKLSIKTTLISARLQSNNHPNNILVLYDGERVIKSVIYISLMIIIINHIFSLDYITSAIASMRSQGDTTGNITYDDDEASNDNNPKDGKEAYKSGQETQFDDDDNQSKGVKFDDTNQQTNPNDNSSQASPDYDYDDDEDELDEDAEEFYQTNPVDQQGSIRLLDRDLNKDDLRVAFGDFDQGSSQILDFYGKARRPKKQRFRKNNVARMRHKTHETGSKSPTARRNTESSLNSGQSDTNQFGATNAQETVQTGVRNCALYLSRGGPCITYDDVEEAAERARSRLRFRASGSQLRSPEPTEATIHAVGQLIELTSRYLAREFNLNWMEIAFELDQIDVRRTTLWADCPIIFRVNPLCTMMNRYRTHTGLCNNLLSTNLGSTNMPFRRMLPGDYGDGIGEPRRASRSNRPLPPVRLVALRLHPNFEVPSIEHSTMFMSWGQLINHDVAMASGAREGTGHGEPCCPNLNTRGVCMPIELSEDDPVYSEYGLRCHEFKRSISGLRPGCSLGPRTQTNTITSFVDASFVYGSSKSMTTSLRNTQRGLLSMWNLFRDEGLKPMLPPQRNDPDGDCVGRSAREGRPYCFRSGDVRTNQHVQLVTLHTIHAREHNRLAIALGQMNPHWTNNRIYHEARHIHIAIVQHILLNEYLPALLGSKVCKKYNLTESPLGSFWDHYDPTLIPGISQAFAAAAFRQGHTRVPSQVYRVSPQHQLVRSYQLRELYRQPWPLFEPGAADEFLLGMLDTPAATFDPFMSLELSGHLLQMPDEPIGLDLASINIQRGRDQGVPGYNAYRDWCGLGRVSSFEDLSNYMNSQSVAAMASLYECVDDIDLFSGGVSEYILSDAQVGPTFACIIGRQFDTLRAADRFWFETSLGPNAFTIAQLDSIKQVSLSRLICANSDSVVTIQEHALLQPHPVYNPRYLCESLPDLDIGLWFEPPGGPIINPASGR